MTGSGENSDEIINEGAEQTFHSTKRPIEKKTFKPNKRQKEQQEDALLTKAMGLIERSAATAEAKNSERDADDIFGEYIAMELKSIKNEEMKRLVKFRIQSLLFSTLSSHPMTAIPPPAPFHPPVLSQWDHPHASTSPSDGWLSGTPSRHSSPYNSYNEDN